MYHCFDPWPFYILWGYFLGISWNQRKEGVFNGNQTRIGVQDDEDRMGMYTIWCNIYIYKYNQLDIMIFGCGAEDGVYTPRNSDFNQNLGMINHQCWGSLFSDNLWPKAQINPCIRGLNIFSWTFQIFQTARLFQVWSEPTFNCENHA